MHIWLVKLEEPVPTDDNFRPYRMSMLADALLSRGHTVTRWCSDFNHLTMKARHGKSCSQQVCDSYSINFIYTSASYSKPVSFMRLANNFLLLRNFSRQAKSCSKPDVIVCSMPTPSMAAACAKISQHFDIPLIIDARDMWPDIIEKELKGWKYYAAAPIIFTMKRHLTAASKTAHSCVGITNFYMQHLLKYARREPNKLDAVFALGYQNIFPLNNSDENQAAKEFWLSHGVDIDSTNNYIYFAGRLNSTVYNVFQTISDAAKELSRSHKNFKFIICGSGQFEKEIRKSVEALDNVILPGEIGSMELAFLRAHSFCAIQPIERREDYQNSLSNKFFEYLSAGLPILTWLDGITEDVITKHNCGYKYNSSSNLISILNELANDPNKLETLSHNAQLLFDEQYDAKNVYGAFSKHIELVYNDYNNRSL